MEKVINTIRRGGRVFMVGAGTSGRLCVLEAAEVPPTFGVPSDLFHGVVAGGVSALSGSVEACGGRPRGCSRLSFSVLTWDPSTWYLAWPPQGAPLTPLGLFAMPERWEPLTVGLSCNAGSELSQLVDIPIEVVVRAGRLWRAPPG